MNVYVTTMYRFGDQEKHSYVLGVWSVKDLARVAGEAEEIYRGGKYKHKINSFILDKNEFDLSLLHISDIGSDELFRFPDDAIVRFSDGFSFHAIGGLSKEEKEILSDGISSFSYLLKSKITYFNQLRRFVKRYANLDDPKTRAFYDVLGKADELCQTKAC